MILRPCEFPPPPKDAAPSPSNVRRRRSAMRYARSILLRGEAMEDFVKNLFSLPCAELGHGNFQWSFSPQRRMRRGDEQTSILAAAPHIFRIGDHPGDSLSAFAFGGIEPVPPALERSFRHDAIHQLPL